MQRKSKGYSFQRQNACMQKKEIFDEWRKIPMVYHFIEAEFCQNK